MLRLISFCVGIIYTTEKTRTEAGGVSQTYPLYSLEPFQYFRSTMEALDSCVNTVGV